MRVNGAQKFSSFFSYFFVFAVVDESPSFVAKLGLEDSRRAHVMNFQEVATLRLADRPVIIAGTRRRR